MPTPTLKDTLARLKALGDPKVRAWNAKNGAGDNQFGVKHGDIRKVAAKIKVNHALALELWETGNTDARQFAVLLLDPAVAIGERLDVYRDWPVSKGCTSPFAPVWIEEMVKRQR
ncbi:MAG: DNA alkylation repair protein [Planctomycetia bacterium]|nr:DNA alkylation repair protein [Planctomycetia bacterium]